MLLIINKRDRTFALKAYDKSTQADITATCGITPQIREYRGRRVPFDEWKQTFKRQLEHICFVFESQLANTSLADHTVFLNVSKFHELLMRKVYETSSCSYR